MLRDIPLSISSSGSPSTSCVKGFMRSWVVRPARQHPALSHSAQGRLQKRRIQNQPCAVYDLCPCALESRMAWSARWIDPARKTPTVEQDMTPVGGHWANTGAMYEVTLEEKGLLGIMVTRLMPATLFPHARRGCSCPPPKGRRWPASPTTAIRRSFIAAAIVVIGVKDTRSQIDVGRYSYATGYCSGKDPTAEGPGQTRLDHVISPCLGTSFSRSPLRAGASMAFKHHAASRHRIHLNTTAVNTRTVASARSFC